MRSFWLLTLAWLRGMVRERSTLFWFFAFPVLFVVIFGLVFGRGDVGTYDVGVAVDTSLPAGAALVEALRGVKAFRVHIGDEGEELKRLKDGDRHAVVTLVPASAASAVPNPAAGTVVVYLDPSRFAAEQIVRPIIQQVVDAVDRQLSGRAPVLALEERSVRSSGLRFIDFFLPGMLGFSLMQSGMFAAMPLVQLRVTRVLKRFGATPVSRAAVLVSQGVARLVLAVAQTMVLLAVGRLLFGVHVGASWPAMIVFVPLGSAVFLALGFAISGLARTEEATPALVQAVSFPMMFLSGVFWPVENFPPFIQLLARVLPLTFLADGLRQAMAGGFALYPQWLNLLALAAWGAIALLLAVRLFKWE
jgi:ABC-2 type transport system permease protein